MSVNSKIKAKINVLTNVEQKTMFSNTVNIEHDDGAVILNFAQTLPDGEEQVENGEKVLVRVAPVFSRIALTLPHFIRFVIMCNNILSELSNNPNDPTTKAGEINEDKNAHR